MLLADVFEHFRDTSMEPHRFKLDPAHYVSAPQMAWDAMLKTTGIQLDLISDPAMYLMIESGMRGGVCMISKRFAQANNKYMGNLYNPTLPSKYIIYLDANNLYGWAMKQPLPQKNFKWLNEVEILEMTRLLRMGIPTHVEILGWIIECDLDYPARHHNYDNDYPLAPERVDIQVEMLSDTQVALARHYTRNRTAKNVKLVPNLMNKKNYVVHGRVLEFLLKNGMQLVKIHRIIEFEQSPWMAPYIQLNTDLRAAATNDADKDFHKLMNNSVYGKTCENLRKRSDIRLVADAHEAEKLIEKPHCLDVRIFDQNLIGVELKKVKVLVNKPSYVGFAVLELSKLLMWQYASLISFIDFYFALSNSFILPLCFVNILDACVYLDSTTVG